MNTTPPFEHYYQILGLDASDPWETVRFNYKKLAQVWHPDRFLENTIKQKEAEAQFLKINKAFSAIEHYVREYGTPPLLDKLYEDTLTNETVVRFTQNTGEEQVAPHFNAFRHHSTHLRGKPFTDFEKAATTNESTAENSNYQNRQKQPQIGPKTLSRAKKFTFSICAIPLLLLCGITLIYWSGDARPRSITSTLEEPKSRVNTDPISKQRLDRSKDRANIGSLSKETFTHGDPTSRILQIHGPPHSTEIISLYEAWYYNKSIIYFKNGSVKEWITHPSFPLNTSKK